MKRRIVRLAGLLIVPLLVAAKPAAATTESSSMRLKGDAAIAIFQAMDPVEPCISNLVLVDAADQIVRTQPGGVTDTLEVFVQVVRFDVCTDTVLFFGTGGTLEADFQVAPNLQFAEVSASVFVFDHDIHIGADIELNVTWSSTTAPKTTNQMFSFVDKDIGILVKEHIRGTMAEAVATGTVIGFGHNLTPDPSEFGTIERKADDVHSVTKSF